MEIVMKMILILSIAYLILIWDFTLTVSTKETKIKVEYNGLFWVSLDYWSINKYQSTDKCVKWIKFEVTKKTIKL
jgi:hypothetical protein